MSPLLVALIAVQQLDTSAEQVRKRLGEMPVAEKAAEMSVSGAESAVAAGKARLAENHGARRQLERQVAEIDVRLNRFEDHKAAVKTNQEFTALLSEIATAKSSKDALEEQILVLLEAADGIAAETSTAERALAEARTLLDTVRADLEAERRTLDERIEQLAAERRRLAADVPPPVLAKYEQILKQRRMLAITPIDGEICAACHVRLRPAIAQQVRRNDGIVQCDSCQRILYAVPKPPEAESA